MQETKANCGPTALANALEALGHTRSVTELADLCRTDATHGTSSANLIRAVKALKESCGLSEHYLIQSPNAQVAWSGLVAAHYHGRAAILLVDRAEHWVASVGLLGQRVWVVDSADENVAISMEQERLMKWWNSGTRRQSYWGLVL